MRLMRTVASVALAAAMCVTLIVLAVAPSSARVDLEMDQAQAGEEFRIADCRAHAASDLYFQRVFRGKKSLTRAEVRAQLLRLRLASGSYSQSLANVSRALLNPPAEWPAAVTDRVLDTANLYLRQSDLLFRARSVGTALRWIKFHRRAWDVELGVVRASRKIRALLNLPASGQDC